MPLQQILWYHKTRAFYSRRYYNIRNAWDTAKTDFCWPFVEIINRQCCRYTRASFAISLTHPYILHLHILHPSHPTPPHTLTSYTATPPHTHTSTSGGDCAAALLMTRTWVRRWLYDSLSSVLLLLAIRLRTTAACWPGSHDNHMTQSTWITWQSHDTNYLIVE